MPRVGYEEVEAPPHEDILNLLKHVRLRGADGYYMWRSSQEDWYDPTYPDDTYGNEAFKTAILDSWQSLDWLFDGVDKEDVEIFQLETNREVGFEWSATETPNGAALIITNLGEESHSLRAWDAWHAGMSWNAVWELFGSLWGSITVSPGDHYFDSCPNAMAMTVAVAVPEPGTIAMLLSLIAGAACILRPRRK